MKTARAGHLPFYNLFNIFVFRKGPSRARTTRSRPPVRIPYFARSVACWGGRRPAHRDRCNRVKVKREPWNGQLTRRKQSPKSDREILRSMRPHLTNIRYLNFIILYPLLIWGGELSTHYHRLHAVDERTRKDFN